MNILISNDDGIYAPGIRALYDILKNIANVTVIAPLEERSTTGHSLHLNSVLRLEKIEQNLYGCSGFPADCVLMGIGHLMKGKRPDLVISGINRGANLGQDLYYSGTIAAAREATFHGIPAIAVSLNLSFNNLEEKPYYESAAKIILKLVQEEMHKSIPELTVLNVNVPNIPYESLKGIKQTKIGFRKYSDEISERVDCRNRKYYWIAGTYGGFREYGETDCEAVEQNYVSITPQTVIDSIDTTSGKLKDLKTNIGNLRL